MRAIDLTGMVFGKLTVLRFAERRPERGSVRRYYLCQCECGNEAIVFAGNLRSGNSTSCGCGKVAACLARATHRQSKTRDYRAWKDMRARCERPTIVGFHNWGGRGIRVCKRWRKFENFIADMGPSPGPGYTIERKDVNKNYQPSNCEWLHRTAQNRNRRDTIRVTFRGKTQALVCWAEQLKIPYSTLRKRHRDGWDIERMMTQPIRITVANAHKFSA